MDILKAEPFWIENRCYRVLPVHSNSKVNIEEYEQISNSSIYEDEYEYDDENLDIIHIKDKFYTNFHVPGILLGLVKGPKGKTQLKLQKEFSVIIKIPPLHSPETGITISGVTRPAVISAFHRINDMIINARLRTEFTHFVSIPTNSTHIQKSFEQFTKDVLSRYDKTRGIDASIFQKPGKLHITVVPLILLDDKDKEEAEAILKDSVNQVLRDIDRELIVNVKGIEYMNDDPSEVDVLYAKICEVDDDTSLQLIADNVMKAFVKKKLAKHQYDKVKLHVTLMNTRFRDNPEINEDDRLKRSTFDATPILKDYLDYEFGDMTISEIHISIRYTKSLNGYYMASCKTKLKNTIM